MSKVILFIVFISVVCSASALPSDSKTSELPSGKKCAAGSTWESQCNNCFCSDTGNAYCSRVGCIGYEDEPERECAPDTRWRNDCNICWCDNGTAACTRKGCINITGGV